LTYSRRILSAEAKKKLSTRDATELLAKRNALLVRIKKWQEVQSLYMPAVAQLGLSSDSYNHPESIHLQLPSDLPKSSWSTLAGGLVEKEKKMRIAQADDSLTELRKLLRISMGLSHFKYSQIGPSQRANTRAHTMMQRYQNKIHRCANRYRDAHSALVKLDPRSDCLVRLQPLEDQDIRRPGRCDDGEDEGEGVRELSWIWMVQKESFGEVGNADDDEVNDSKCS
jgi:hypothetical protein